MSNALVQISQTVDKTIAQQIKTPTFGMTMLPLNTSISGLGKTSIYSFLYADRAEAKIGMDIDHNMADTVDITGASTKVPVIQDQVKIPHRTWKAFVDNGVPLSSDLAYDMLRKVNTKIDAMVLNGWAYDGTTYEVLGLNQVAGTSTTGSATSAYGGGYYSIEAAIADLEDAGVYSTAWDAVFYSGNYKEVKASINSTSGRIEMQDIMSLLGPGGQFKSAPSGASFTANTGVVKPAALESNRQYFELFETTAFMNHSWYVDGNEETGDIMVELIWAGVPKWKHLSSGTDVSVAKITGL